MTVESRRLSILTTQEVEELYGPPRFTEEYRRLLFDLSTAERAAVVAVREMSSAVHLALQCDYFKAKRRFFVYERDEVPDDLRYIIEQYLPDRDLGELRARSKPTRLEQQQIVILRLFDHRLCYSATKEDLESKAQRMAMLTTPGEGEQSNNPFYSQLPGIGIADLLWFVAERTAFLGSFTHVLDRYVKHDPDPCEILADIVAMGTNMGMRKMAEVSGLSHPSLVTTAQQHYLHQVGAFFISVRYT